MSRRDRRVERRYVFQHAMMAREDGTHIGPCTMLDVSAGGARLRVGNGEVPDEFVLLLSQFDQNLRRRCSVAWRADGEIGIKFLLTQAAAKA